MKEIEDLLIKHRDSSYETGQEEYEEIILSRFSALSDKVKCLTVDYGLLKVDNHFNKTYLESAEIMIAKLEAKVKELEGKDLYWRERVTELEHNENKFPTMAEFSNLQDDYESLKKQNAELKRQMEELRCFGN